MKDPWLVRTSNALNRVIVPAGLLAQLSAKAGQIIHLRCGSATAASIVAEDKVVVKEDKTVVGGDNALPKTNQCISMSKHLMDVLHLPNRVQLHVRTSDNKDLQLGPVIGLLAFSSHVPDRLIYYKAYANAAKISNYLFYVFKKNGVNYENKTITGYYFNYDSDCWQEMQFPLPDVILDRRYPNSDKTHQRLAAAIGKDKIFNNITMINKIQFYSTLIKDPYLKDFLPETRVLRDSRDLEYFLKKYETVILKPLNAMKGSGIITVTQNAKRELECKFKTGSTTTAQVLPSPDQIFNVMSTVAGRERKYLVQQGISCMDYSGGPFSLRTCPTKNRLGNWVIPGMLALASMGRSFVTNYSAGAERVALNSLYKEILPKLSQSKEQFLSLINRLSIKTAEILDRAYGPLGELGLDIIVDKHGKPWLLEANGNPGRIPIFYQTEYPLWPAQLYHLPLSYAAFLAGFN